MGRKHRANRTRVKKELRRLGWYENEFGELQKRLTKAEVRTLLLLRKRQLRLEMETRIIERAIEVAKADICAEEDARALTALQENSAQLAG